MITPWKLIKTETIFKKYSMHIQRRDYQQPNGKIADYYIRTSGGGACVLALTEDNKVVTVREYRPGPNKVLNEMPGGFIDEGQTPLEAAVRELREESGYEGEAVYGGMYYEDAYTDRERHWCIVTNCKKVGAQELEPREFAEVVLMDLDEFIAQARAGQMTDAAAAVLALDRLNLLPSEV